MPLHFHCAINSQPAALPLSVPPNQTRCISTFSLMSENRKKTYSSTNNLFINFAVDASFGSAAGSRTLISWMKTKRTNRYSTAPFFAARSCQALSSYITCSLHSCLLFKTLMATAEAIAIAHTLSQV